MELVAVKTGCPRPALFRALGKSDPPEFVETSGAVYRLDSILKHDSWAATAIYRPTTDPTTTGQIICKFNRQQPILGVPMAWLGRKLARREMEFYRLLADLPCIAQPCGPVKVDGKAQDHVAAHRFVPGHPLGESENPGASFFSELERGLAAIHERGVAFMDLHKRENIIVGTDGRPYLIDFQVSFLCKPTSRFSPMFAALRLFQSFDLYHLLKHKLRCSGLPAHEIQAIVDRHRPALLRLHRLIAVPWRTMRRRLLVLLRIRTGKGEAQSEHFTEDGLRDSISPTRRAA